MIDNFKKQYDPRYQDILNKALVGKKIASYRLKANLMHGSDVTRFKLDVSKVKVRTITPLVDRVIDPVKNATQMLKITEYKGTTFPVSQWEKTLSGNPSLGTMIGKEVAVKVATYLDADILSEVRNAEKTFDTGDLTTGLSNGVPLSLDTTNVPKFVTRAQAKLNQGGARTGKKAFVVDDYTLAIISETVIGRNTEMGDNFLKNGYSGKIVSAEIYVSDNLTGEAEISFEGVPEEGTLTIGGVTLSFTDNVSGEDAGSVAAGANAAETAANVAAALNAGAGEGTLYKEFTADDRGILDDLRISATADGTTLTVVGVGAGRMIIATDRQEIVIEKNFIHAFYGVIGSIDVVVQKEVNMFMTQAEKQDTKYIFNDAIYGIKTFDDGAKKMIDVLISAE